jgi:hypothetical protein
MLAQRLQSRPVAGVLSDGVDEPGEPFGDAAERSSPARVYNWLLGGYANFESDRQSAQRLVAADTQAPLYARMNRALLRRMLRHLVRAGVRQFLDVGCGHLSIGSTRQVLAQVAPGAHAVYVDADPAVVAHCAGVLAGDCRAGVVEADLRDPQRIFDDAVTRTVLDFAEPVAIVMLAVLHFVPSADDPAAIVTRYAQECVAGSYLAVSHASWPARVTEDAIAARDAYEQTIAALTLRSPDEIRALFGPFAVVDPPGVCRVPSWRPDVDAADVYTGAADQVPGFAGLGRLGGVRPR